MASDGGAVRVRAPGKINLQLAVGAPSHGFHALVTVFHAVSLNEEVTATPMPDGEVLVTVSGRHAASTPTGPDNLAALAATLLAERTGVTDGVHLHIDKAVPVAGGMAGGSADAAAALVACDALWQTGLSRADLAELGAAIGSDVPFALHGHTAVGTGRGTTLSPAMTRGRYHWVLATQTAGLSTAKVFARYDELRPRPAEPRLAAPLMRALRSGDLRELGAQLSNDLQGAAVDLMPSLADTLAVALDAGALGAVVSGSGPTVLALARDRAHSHDVAAALLRAEVCAEVLHATGPAPGTRVVYRDGLGAAPPAGDDD